MNRHSFSAIPAEDLCRRLLDVMGVANSRAATGKASSQHSDDQEDKILARCVLDNSELVFIGQRQ
jgi:hypothetical protein